MIGVYTLIFVIPTIQLFHDLENISRTGVASIHCRLIQKSLFHLLNCLAFCLVQSRAAVRVWKLVRYNNIYGIIFEIVAFRLGAFVVLCPALLPFAQFSCWACGSNPGFGYPWAGTVHGPKPQPLIHRFFGEQVTRPGLNPRYFGYLRVLTIVHTLHCKLFNYFYYYVGRLANLGIPPVTVFLTGPPFSSHY